MNLFDMHGPIQGRILKSGIEKRHLMKSVQTEEAKAMVQELSERVDRLSLVCMALGPPEGKKRTQ